RENFRDIAHRIPRHHVEAMPNIPLERCVFDDVPAVVEYNVELFPIAKALTVKPPYPSCHAKEPTPTSSWTHLEETDFISRRTSASVCVARKPTSKWTWSAMPPTAPGTPSSVRIAPPR